ncbi:MAG: hypothetical protein M5R36_00480 [Deltaproteobacteria bacterium]|nr:hypothetical protein [Deltaproteobacteria bacterium]
MNFLGGSATLGTERLALPLAVIALAIALPMACVGCGDDGDDDDDDDRPFNESDLSQCLKEARNVPQWELSCHECGCALTSCDSSAEDFPLPGLCPWQRDDDYCVEELEDGGPDECGYRCDAPDYSDDLPYC